MVMRTLILSFFALAFNLGMLQAQPSNKEAKALLEKAATKFKSYKNVSAQFTLDIKNDRVKPPVQESNSGSLLVVGQDYSIKTKDAQRIKKGANLYEIADEFKEVYVSKPEAGSDELLSPDKLLDRYMTGYSYKMGGSEKIQNRTVNYVILKPTASEDVDYIQVGIFADTQDLYSITQRGTNGTETRIVISNLKTNQNLPANAVQFDEKGLKAKGYTIIR